MISNDTLQKLKGWKTVSLRELKVINKESIHLGLNRAVEWKTFFNALKNEMNKVGSVGHWRGMKTNVMLQPLMVHEHKGGKKTDPHMRCLVETCQPNFPYSVLIDVKMTTFKRLMDVNEFLKVA